MSDLLLSEVSSEKQVRSKFWTQTSILIWKCYLQRQRRWRLLALETMLAGILYLAAILTAKPVFLTPLQDEPVAPLTFNDILASFNPKIILGSSPNSEPYHSIMVRVTYLLNTTILEAPKEDGLNDLLYDQSLSNKIKNPIIWVIWRPEKNNVWAFNIRSTERAYYFTGHDTHRNPHLRAGFLAVQAAVSHAILEHSSTSYPDYKLKLVSMPVTPLMQEEQVRKTLSAILLFYTLALLPPVMETQALVVSETGHLLKRALRLRSVDYSSMYISWIAYGYFTALPAGVLGAITLIMLFRWIHILVALVIVLAYLTVMIMLAMMMAMFHSKAHIACIWSILFTLLLTYLSELLVHHKWDSKHGLFTFLLHMLLPPLGLIHAFNEFALLQIGSAKMTELASDSLIVMLLSWTFMAMLSYAILMLLQRTVGQHRAIGGQVSWRSIIFKKPVNTNALRVIEAPIATDSSKVQEVDEFVAKAVTFTNVSKNIMGVEVLKNIQFDIYRTEHTMLFAEHVQEQMIFTIDDLLTGLTFPDHGKINVLGEKLKPGTLIMSTVHMMGYCHRSNTLIEDLTVEEHFNVFITICLWNRSRDYAYEYAEVRSKRLIAECDLETVRHERVRDLGTYYRAQLCWALALLLEPRIIVIPHFLDQPMYTAVIRDKIMRYKKYLTIISLSFSSIHLEYADRFFMFDTKILVFGGTPAYMYFKYGREYRVRITLTGEGKSEESISNLLERAKIAGATIRALLGSLLILRLPASPTETIARFIQDITQNSATYGLVSFNLSVADSDEVCRRAMTDARNQTFDFDIQAFNRTNEALEKISAPVAYKRNTSIWTLHLKHVGWKFICFHMQHKMLFSVTIISAIAAGIILGLSLSSVLKHMDKAKKLLKDEVLSVEEGTNTQETTLVIRTDRLPASMAIAKAYVMSDTNVFRDDIKEIEYTALSAKESLTDYLVTRAIDSPQIYVYKYAYGLDVSNKSKTLSVNALYSPLQHDNSAAARSLARVYMALMRYYTGSLDASIKVTDEPLVLDLSPWMKGIQQPPLFVQLLLILTISHITLLPSGEYGLVRHTQKHASNFSPLRYWCSHYFCDLMLYWLLVGIMSSIMQFIISLNVPFSYLTYSDLFIVPLMLMVYGVGCIPQAYIFSLGPHVALNTMTYMMFNLVFGETTIIAKFFYGESLTHAVGLMSWSPQFNMAHAYVKIRQLFSYNSECVIFKKRNLCLDNTLHKCCKKCGVLQDCFVRKKYFNRSPGVLTEFIAMFTTAAFFLIVLILIDNKVPHRIWRFCTKNLASRDLPPMEIPKPGVAREIEDVRDKKKEILSQKTDKVNTFGEHLLVSNITLRRGGEYALRNVHLGIAKGEAVALAGLKRHGRLSLCEVLAGCRLPVRGDVWVMSKWRLSVMPHLYSQRVSLCCEQSPLPAWLCVHDALQMLAGFRGVPTSHAVAELHNLENALDIKHLLKTRVCDLTSDERPRVHFAAAVIGAPPVIVIDEGTAHQSYSVRRAMYSIMYSLRKKGHAIFVTSSSVERHLPVTNRLAILVDGYVYDVDSIDNWVERYSTKGYTVVVHLKDDADVPSMFKKYFNSFQINDTSDVLVNIQVYDENLEFADIFEKLEHIKTENPVIYSYIVTTTPIDYIYNYILNQETGKKRSKGIISWKYFKRVISYKSKQRPSPEAENNLIRIEKKYDITTLKELPWSVIFHTDA